MGNILINQDLVRLYTRKTVSHRCMMKVDLRKAYDSIEWKFVHQKLYGLNFPPRFIDWIMHCVTTTSFSIRGHQVSCYLHGCLPVFSEASGLSISNEKSDIILNGIKPECENDIITHTGFKKGKLPFKYLGVQISHKRLTKLDCNILVDKMSMCLSEVVILNYLIGCILEYLVWICRNTWRLDGYVPHPDALIKRLQDDCRMRLMNVNIGSLKREEIAWCTQRDLM
ncbi:uncharacterized protein LOC141617642 [Silene latifolia]|uniref:uncharacterized protein LOC141617642 n=1 Tax=Silene latifolia TaxID=37657 RepID=UPI003D77009B